LLHLEGGLISYVSCVLTHHHDRVYPVLLEAAIHDEGDGLILCDKVMTALILVTLCFFFFWQNWHYSCLQSVILWIYCSQSWASSWCLPTPGNINCSMYWLQYRCLCNNGILKSCAFQLFAQWGNFVINEPQIWCSTELSRGFLEEQTDYSVLMQHRDW
jgi:hypothetical protein